jgi:hypothetical protein
MNKKELLDKAFNEAIVEVNVNSMEGIGIMEEIITTSMNAFATREKVEFKPEEIRATIIAGLETIKQAGDDFTLQTRIMF